MSRRADFAADMLVGISGCLAQAMVYATELAKKNGGLSNHDFVALNYVKESVESAKSHLLRCADEAKERL